jgi:hypothetical protein
VRIVQQITGGLSRQFTITSDGRDPHFNNTFYQFGRKDPLPGLKDGYTLRFGAGYDTNSGRPGVSSSYGTIPLAIRNPHLFYPGTSTSRYDWNYNTPTTEGTGYGYKQSVDNLWDIDNDLRTKNNNPVGKTVYDPSPVGFTIPPEGAFSGFTTTGAQSRTAGEWSVAEPTGDAFERDGGWRFRSGGRELFFARTGYLRYDNGEMSGPVAGYYWSVGPVNDGYGYYLQFNAGEINPHGNGARSYGVSIRPVREL